ncbi:hypothetical protein LUZ60_016247 [Juncus effusus]|nr:hypothetical protein LUZ60_016247 [Juncus effusus]
MEGTHVHVVLIPLPAHGHISPLLALATRIQQVQPGLTITLVSTPRNIDSIRSTLSPSSSLNLHSLPFSPSDYGLPDSESTRELLPQQFGTFFRAVDQSLHLPFDELIAKLSEKSPVCIISDMFFGWTVDVARKYKVFHSIFLGMSAFAGAILVSLWMNLPHIHTHSNQFSLPEFPEVVVERSQLATNMLLANGTDPMSTSMQRRFSSFYTTDCVLVNTIEELEPIGLDMLRTALKVPISPIGSLIGSAPTSSAVISKDFEIFNWLDLKDPDSVLYISFGSQNSININQMMELALGLDKSRIPFIWVLRPPLGFNMKDEFKDEWLPYGFKERMKKENRGYFVHGWASQVKILGHKSIGAFLSHCGWNSVLESLNSGLPIIGWPLSAEQPFNVTLLDNLGVCVEVARNNRENSMVDKDKIREVVEMVLGENEKGREMRKRAGEIKEMLNDAWKQEDGVAVNELREFFRLIKMSAN